MSRQELIESIAYCGLICGKCHLRDQCDGCRNTAKLCARANKCYQRVCCLKKGLAGCWECTDFPCGEDMHGTLHDLRIRAFVAFIMAEGVETLIECILGNEERGIYYGHHKDYDNMKSEDDVIRLLKMGLDKMPKRA